MNKLTLDKVKYRDKWVVELNYTSGIWKPELHEALLRWQGKLLYIERNEDSVVWFVKDFPTAKKFIKYVEAYLSLLDDEVVIEDRLGIYE